MIVAPMVGRISMKDLSKATSSLESRLSRGDRWRDPARPHKKHPFEGGRSGILGAAPARRRLSLSPATSRLITVGGGAARHSKKSLTLDVYSHVMLADEIESAQVLSLLANEGSDDGDDGHL
jgi:hypothetical protein